VTRHVSEERQHAAALQPARRMIARGERPGYRLRAALNGSWAVDGLPGVTMAAPDRDTALAAMKVAIAEVLIVAPEAFDLE
jgi:hypothetical protein